MKLHTVTDNQGFSESFFLVPEIELNSFLFYLHQLESVGCPFELNVNVHTHVDPFVLSRISYSMALSLIPSRRIVIDAVAQASTLYGRKFLDPKDSDVIWTPKPLLHSACILAGKDW